MEDVIADLDVVEKMIMFEQYFSLFLGELVVRFSAVHPDI